MDGFLCGAIALFSVVVPCPSGTLIGEEREVTDELHRPTVVSSLRRRGPTHVSSAERRDYGREFLRRVGTSSVRALAHHDEIAENSWWAGVAKRRWSHPTATGSASCWRWLCGVQSSIGGPPQENTVKQVL